ncbi:uncharacterized protein B0P05DRAFT_555208 [Gilbertella persicaria]|uniref:uncharacterized protein n=1 Tax=Gilbertella persicaria TaxID=101096 RepID=UPI00221E8E17|nr:uncharacterized protein B0P05DRAFT_555208 [Gilbertella persicaria]KAI8063663.1 hypothetical protein B0P05DRAFT_555208 [Gilbertella persicaria]
MRTTLFVAGFGSRTRARDLAYEFERYGRLVRCDIPAPKSYTAKVYAFVEFEDPHDAEDAFNEMHGRRIDGYTISVQWARNAPSATWRLGGPSQPAPRPSLPPPPPPLHYRYPSYRYSPYHRRSTSRSRKRSMSPPRGRSPPRYYHSRSRSPIPTLHTPIPTYTEKRSPSP